jgi:tRNA1Val (adenine37-N6)-methyltransferase
MSKESIHQLFGYEGMQIIQREDILAFSVDSLLLADFVNIPKRVTSIVDFGTGNAPIPLYLSLKTKKPILGFEIQAESVDLAKRSVALNHLEHQITILQEDIRLLHEQYPASAFDLIVSNPPFFPVKETSPLNDSHQKSLARHEITLDLATLIQQAKRLLSTGGIFCMIHRVDRLQEIFRLMDRFAFAIKRLKFVYPKVGQDAVMVLIEARNNGSKVGLRLEPPLYISDEQGNYTETMRAIHLFGKQE